MTVANSSIQSSRSQRLARLIVLASIAVVGCGPVTTSVTPTSSIVPSDLAQLFGIEWVRSDSLILEFSADSTTQFRLGELKLEGGAVRPFHAPDSDCAGLELGNPLRLSTSRIALTAVCQATVGSGDPDRTEVLEYDLDNGDYSPWASVGGVDGPPGQIAVEPDGSRTLVAMGTLCGTIVEATPEGAQPWPVVVSDGTNSFSLADWEPGPDCSQRGWADFPTWSPDGNQIAFFAAPSAIGTVGPARASVAS